MLDNPSCAFLQFAISLLPAKVIKGLVVGYLDVHGRILLKNRVDVAQELRAQLDSDRR